MVDRPLLRVRDGLRWLWPEWIDSNLRIVLLARVSMSAARGIAGVVTALYLAAEGFSALQLGALFLCVTVVSAVLASVIGLMSDRWGRKPFLISIPLLAAVAAVVYAFDRAPLILFLFAALGTFGRGAGAGGGSVGPYQPAESALVAESAPGNARTAAFGRVAFASSLGALCGGLLAALAQTHGHLTPASATAVYRPAFLAAAVLAAAAGTMALWLHENRQSRPQAKGRNRIRWPRKSWPMLWRFWVTNGVNGFAIGMFGPFLSYWLYLRYGATPAEIGVLFAFVNLGSLVSTLAAAGIGRRLGTVTAIVVVRAITGVLLVPMVLAPNFWLAGGIYLVRMLAQRVGLPLRQSFTQEVADPAERASLAALSNLPAQGTMAGSQVLAGYLFDEVSLAAPFEVAAVFQCLNAVLYALLFGRLGKGHERAEEPVVAAPFPLVEGDVEIPDSEDRAMQRAANPVVDDR
ncbi:MAG: MFS transporter [Candidatus Dormibacteria bacterium]